MPMLLVLSDLKNNVFGAYFSFVPTVSENFQGKFSEIYVKPILSFFSNFLGNGETFLFSLKPKIKAYKWTGDNR